MGSPSVPYPHDVVIDSNGYVFADSEEQKAAYSLSPIFVSRQNTQGNYGDNQQDFWLTWTQKDWSGGEQGRYEARDNDSQTKYWKGVGVDARVPGELSLRKSTTNVTFAATPTSAVGSSGSPTVLDRVYVATATTLYHVIYDGTITVIGAHGLGAAPSRWGMAFDGANVFLSTGSAGTVGVRRFNVAGAAFSTFSATSADSLAFLNNTLYGYNEATAQLNRYDPTTGVATALFNWKDAVGTAVGSITTKLVPFGGKLLILRYRTGGSRGPELWVYDGTSTSQLTEFPASFLAYDLAVMGGAIFISGAFEKHTSTIFQRPAIYFYKDGQQDLLWRATNYVSAATSYNLTRLPPLAVYDEGLIWQDFYESSITYYNPQLGGVSGIISMSGTGPIILATGSTFFAKIDTGTTTGTVFPSLTAPTSAQVIHSLVDFDTSLRKIFRGVRVEFDAAADGDGGSVDISYRFNDVPDGSFSGFTSLQTGAAAGIEYSFPNPVELVNYRSVSIQLTLNKGTSTDGPKLKRLQVRGIPVQPAFKRRQYVLLLGGRDGESPVQLRDGSYSALDGKDLATALQTSAGRSSPFAITDHLGTYTAVIEDLKMTEYKPEQWIAAVTCRQV